MWRSCLSRRENGAKSRGCRNKLAEAVMEPLLQAWRKWWAQKEEDKSKVQSETPVLHFQGDC